MPGEPVLLNHRQSDNCLYFTVFHIDAYLSYMKVVLRFRVYLEGQNYVCEKNQLIIKVPNNKSNKILNNDRMKFKMKVIKMKHPKSKGLESFLFVGQEIFSCGRFVKKI